MDEIREREAEVTNTGLEIDEGNLIAGPFIPDGNVRIYDPETLTVVAEGSNVEEALRDWDGRPC